jgi:hypothetical protein
VIGGSRVCGQASRVGLCDAIEMVSARQRGTQRSERGRGSTDTLSEVRVPLPEESSHGIGHGVVFASHGPSGNSGYAYSTPLGPTWVACTRTGKSIANVNVTRQSVSRHTFKNRRANAKGARMIELCWLRNRPLRFFLPHPTHWSNPHHQR